MDEILKDVRELLDAINAAETDECYELNAGTHNCRIGAARDKLETYYVKQTN